MVSHDALHRESEVLPPAATDHRGARGVGSAIGHAIAFPFRLASRVVQFPFRLARRRISVQLIFSYLLVVVLTALVVEIVGIAAAVLVAGRFVTNDQFDADMGNRALAMAQTLGGVVPPAIPTTTRSPQPAAVVAVPSSVLGRLDASVNGWLLEVGTTSRDYVAVADRTILERQLTQLTQALPKNAAVAPPEASAIGDGKVAYALVTDPTGRIVASSDHAWGPTDEPVEAVRFSKVAEVTRRAIELRGHPTAYGNLYVQDAADGITVAAYPLLASNGRLLGVVTLESHRNSASIQPLELLGGIGVFSIAYLLFLTMAALVVAIPVGIWRARTFSGRLKRLAAAADAMAHGDLNRRVPVTGQDEIARLSERFNEMSDQLSAADRARKAFVANISHELRTPVAILQGTIERMLTRPASRSEESGGTVSAAAGDTVTLAEPASTTGETAALRVMHQETETLSRLIDDLFTLARIEETALPLEITPVNLDEIAGQAAAGLRPLAWEQRKVSVQSLVTAAIPPVLADVTRLRQILNNLLYNALRHTPEGGVIVIDAVPRGDVVEIAVTDTGIGISPEHLASVFERFYQAERGHRHHDGSGLGLHIVKQLVEAQHGTISVESATGEGTTFRFTLPRAL